MRNSLAAAALVGCSLPLLGCRDGPTLTEPVNSETAVARAERVVWADAFVMGGDPSNPLALQAGFDPGVTVEDICADPSGLNLNGIGQAVFTPPGGFLSHTSAKDAVLVVYQFGGGPVTDPCQVVGAPIVGTGTGSFTFKVSDPGPGAIAIHVTVHGTIDLTSGGRARLFATARIILLPDDSLLFDVERVRLTPI